MFKLAEVKENHDFGVATDGLKGVFIDKTGKIIDELRFEDNFERIKKFFGW